MAVIEIDVPLAKNVLESLRSWIRSFLRLKLNCDQLQNRAVATGPCLYRLSSERPGRFYHSRNSAVNLVNEGAAVMRDKDDKSAFQRFTMSRSCW